MLRNLWNLVKTYPYKRYLEMIDFKTSDILLLKGDDIMSKKKKLEASLQGKIDQTRDAMNAENGFKTVMSSGTHGAGDAYHNS